MQMMKVETPEINSALVHRLISAQFPQWEKLAIQPVSDGGVDNKTFHLGEHMLVRMPSAMCYASQVEKEQRWLPRLAPLLPIPIPTPLGLGSPTEEFPWKWSIYSWITGATALPARITCLNQFANDLARFLHTLQRIDFQQGPLPGEHNFHRGGNLISYDAQVRQMLSESKNKIDVESVLEIWELALAYSWQTKPVWVHGDVSVGNLLVKDGELCAVIDFGLTCVGDPACDLVIAWTLFNGESRLSFMKQVALDENTWIRARAWTLWKALFLLTDDRNSSKNNRKINYQLIEDVIADHKM